VQSVLSEVGRACRVVRPGQPYGTPGFTATQDSEPSEGGLSTAPHIVRLRYTPTTVERFDRDMRRDALALLRPHYAVKPAGTEEDLWIVTNLEPEEWDEED